MIRIAATVHGGVIVPHQPIDWPDGTEVEVQQVSELIDDETPDSPEEIERWIAEMDAIPTPTMSEEAWAQWEQDRQEDKAWQLAQQEAREKKIQAGLQ